ncbi:glycosyltransferase family 2 protein [Psychrobacter sp. DM8]|uniref:glycosyltransferase family 2 protein n=1 Tax=Psychrobacter sp. DM8 TaxID=3440636 RepID=UPI003F5059F2
MFSIVIPLYNKGLSITDTINSVLNQTYQDFEVLIINDGSTDSSVDAVSRINDTRIRLINQSNQGVSAARNRGITEANNDWIAFLDGDDLWKKNHLEEIVRMMETFPNERVYVTSFEYSDNRKMFIHPRSKPIFKVKNYFNEALKEELICTIIVAIHKSCFEEVGCFSTALNRGEDTDLWIRLSSNFDIIKSSVITATYRVEAENRTRLSKNLDSTYVYHLNLESVKNSDKRKYFENMITNRLYQYSRSKDFKNFFKLKKKYPTVTYADFVKYTIKHISKRILK